VAVRDPDNPIPASSDQGSEVGVGEPLSAADQRWQQAAAELEPARSLTRAEDRAKQLVGTVSVVGVLLTGSGLVAAARLQTLPPARWLAIVAVALALTGVVLALWTLLLREQDVAVNDLRGVQRWYAAQFRRARLVQFAGMLLLGGMVLAGLASVVALAAQTDDRPVIELVVSGTGVGAQQTADVSVRWAHLPSDRLVLATVTGAMDTSGLVLAQGVASPGADGTASVSFKAIKLQRTSGVLVTVVAGARSCTTTLTLGAPEPSEPNTMACRHT
jgi:hypothetical protein